MRKVSEKPTLAQEDTKVSLPGKHWWRQDSTRLVRLAIVVGLIAASFLYLAWRAASPVASGGTASCSTQDASFQPGATPAPSSIHTIKQAYNCILDNYPTTLDPRGLLQHAMSGMVNDLVQHHQDQHNTVLPALTGDRQADWQAFERTYTTITAHRSLNQQQLVAAAIAEMVNSLHDDHARYLPARTVEDADPPQPGTQIGLGIHLSFYPHQSAQASPPLFIRGVDSGSPAEKAGLRPGDIIVTINGFPPFIKQGIVPQVVNPLQDSAPVQLQIQHPGADDMRSVDLVPTAYPATPLVSTHMLPSNILYVRLIRFDKGAYDRINSAVQRAGAQIKGVILDLRGNGGGDLGEQRSIISLFIHNQIIETLVDRQGQRSEVRTDDSVPLLHVRLVALIDRGCASACDATAMDIHDLHLGRLVGERTAGMVSGPSLNFTLDDGSEVTVPLAFMQGPSGEIVDDVGVPPDDEVYPTSADLAAGHDPILEKALQGL